VQRALSEMRPQSMDVLFGCTDTLKIVVPRPPSLIFVPPNDPNMLCDHIMGSFRTHFSARFVTGFAHNWKKIKLGYFLHIISTRWKTAPLIQFFLIQSHLLLTTNSPTQSMFCKTYLSCTNSKNKLCLRSL